MPAPNEKLAAALEELRSLQQLDGSRVFSSDQLGRTARERLLKHGYVQEIMKGWLMSASPTAAPGDTTPWLASFWEFCRRYCEHRFGSEWHLSPDQSLLIHAENTTIPKQVIIHSPRAGNNRVDLLFGTSFFALRARAMPPASDLEVKNGLRIYQIPAALTRVHEEFFTRYPIETQVVAGSVRDSSRLLVRLLEGGHATIAGRLAGLFRRLGQTVIADEIVATMRAADHDVRRTSASRHGPVVVRVPPQATEERRRRLPGFRASQASTRRRVQGCMGRECETNRRAVIRARRRSELLSRGCVPPERDGRQNLLGGQAPHR